MQFLRQDVVTAAEASQVGRFDIAFYGKGDLDDRSKHSVALSKAVARQHCQVSYDAAQFTLTVNGEKMRVDSLDDLPRKFRAQSIVLDATSMEFPEILFVLSAYRMQQVRPRCGFFYVEPEGYAEKEIHGAAVPGNAFDLSSGFKPKAYLPLFSRMLSSSHQAHLVAFLGFEGDRLMRVLHDDDGHFYRKVTIVFGVPPFQPNWDLHALMANSSLLEQPNTHVMYCGANNPRAAYKLLESAHAGLTASATSRLLIAPFGTKPMALGSALYCLEHQNVLSSIFDHPVLKSNRTYGIHRCHWYEVLMT